MAQSGSTSVSFTKYDDLKFSWWVISQSIENNHTVIGWKTELVSGSDGRIQHNYERPWNITVNGETYSGMADINVANWQTKQLASGTTTIPHNADGSKTFSYSFSQRTDITFSGVFIGAVTGSGSGTLDTIPRKSSLSASNGILGTAQTLTVTKQATNFTHTIKYQCGNKSGTICDKSSATSVSWTPPNELAEASPSLNYVSVTLTITTYNGSTSVGDSSVVITCDIPYTSTFVPVLAHTSADAMGYASKYGAYVQGKSSVKIDITTYGAYGARISSCRTIFDGYSYTEQSFTTDAIKAYGTLPITITVTDSRGRTTTVTQDISVLRYEHPKVTSLRAFRSDEDGNSAPGGAYLAVRFNSDVKSLNNKNKAMFAVSYKAINATSYEPIDVDKYNGTYTVTDGLLVVPADANTSYEFLFSVYDDFHTTTKSTTGSSAKKVWSLLKKNNEIVGMAFGKTAEFENVFDIGWPVKFSGGGDCVVEQGEKDGWTYRKWDSGVAECWKTQTFTTTINTQFGSLYCGNASARISYPFAFTQKPVENVTLQSGSTQAILYCEGSGYGVNGAYASAQYNVFKPSAVTTEQTFYLSFYVIGKWK